MTYNPAIPQAADLPSISQPQMLINFGQANTLFGHDHYPFNFDNVNFRGLHKFTTLQQQDNGPFTDVGQFAVYTKAVGNITELFFRRPNSGTEIQMTPAIDPNPINNGQSFLPGGLLIQWGTTAAIPPGVSTPINFPNAFSANAFTVIATMQKTASGNSQPVNIVQATITPTTFNLYHTASGPHSVCWIAIGLA